MTSQDERNFGIDLLRLLSMFYVVILHLLGHGGLLEAVSPGSRMYIATWSMEMWCYCAVNIFALISGYVGFHGDDVRTNYSRIFLIWAEVVFYSVFFIVLALIAFPSYVHKDDCIAAIFPVTKNGYWFFTAYIGVMIISPCIKRFVSTLSGNDAKKWCVLILCCFVLINGEKDIWHFGNGYSFVWIALMYSIGALIKKGELWESVSKTKAFFIIVATWILILLVKINDYPNVWGVFRASYVSLSVVVISIGYLLLFKQLKIGFRIQTCLSVLAPSFFSIYLINDNTLLRTRLIEGNYSWLADKSIVIMLLYVIISAIAFVVVALLIDSIRRWIFKLLNVEERTKSFELLFNKAVNKLIKKADF